MPKPKDVDKHWRKKGHSGFVSLEVPSETIEKLDLMLEELGFKNRSAYIRYILERELLCWEEK
jgi:metal-responsive CopG/Arc/MetJ family transcriptional regulator